MVNRILKGRRSENEVLAVLKSRYKNALIWKAIRTKFKNIDLFGLFDLMLKTKSTTVYVQVKTNYKGKLKKLLEKKGNQGVSIKDFIKEYLKKNEQVQIWNKTKKWKVFKYPKA